MKVQICKSLSRREIIIYHGKRWREGEERRRFDRKTPKRPMPNVLRANQKPWVILSRSSQKNGQNRGCRQMRRICDANTREFFFLKN
jgi:hypothetical protein